MKEKVGGKVSCEQDPGWVKCELVECSLGRGGRSESNLVTRGSAWFTRTRYPVYP